MTLRRLDAFPADVAGVAARGVVATLHFKETMMRASESTAELRAKIDASIKRIGLRQTVDMIAWDAIGKCAAKLDRPLSVAEAAEFYVTAWYLVVDRSESSSTISEQTTRFAALIKARMDWKDPRGPGEAVN